MKKNKNDKKDLLNTLKKLEQVDARLTKKPKKSNKANPFILLFVIAIGLAVFYAYISSPAQEKINEDI